MKKFLSLIVVGLAVFSFACSKCSKTDVTDVKTVTIWAHQSQESEVNAIKEIIANFNKAHKHIKAELTIIPSGVKHSYETKVTAAKLSKKLPDILDVDGPFVSQYAWSNILTPIDDMVSNDMRKDFLPSIIKQGTYKDKLYTLGAFESGLAIYFNKDILKEFGITPPTKADDAWQWNEFVDNLKKIHKAGVTPLSLSMNWGPGEWYTYAFTPIMWSAGQKSLISPSGKTTYGFLNSKASAAGLGLFQDLFKKKLSLASPPPDLFEQGKAAFAWNGHWMMDKYSNAKGLNWGLMPLPYIKDQVAPSGSWCWGITTGAKDKKAAFEVLSWIVGPDTGVAPMVKANNAPPSRWSALKYVPEYQKYPRKLFIDQLKNFAHPRPSTPSYGQFSAKASEAIQNISLGKSPWMQLEKAAREIDKVLKEQEKVK